MSTSQKLQHMVQMVWVSPIFASLLVWHGVIFPHTNGKMIFMSSLMMLGIALFTFINKQDIVLPKLSLILIALWVSAIISTIAGIDPLQSLWGTDTRAFGLWIVTIVLLYHILSVQMFHTSKQHERFMLWGILAMITLAWIPALKELMQVGATRVTSVFGNPILYANTALFGIFIGGYLYSKTQGMWRYVSIFLAIGAGIAVIMTQTRGAILGVIAGLIACAVLYSIKKRPSKKIMNRTAGALMGVIVILIAIQGTSISSTLGLDRILTTNYLESSASQRLLMWKSALQGVSQKPLFGWGPENYDYFFDKNFDPQHVAFGLSQTWSDRAHNEFIDMLIMQGVLGLLLYIGLFIYALKILYEKSAKDTSLYWLFGLIIAYGVQAQFAFNGPVSALLITIILAKISALQTEINITVRNNKFIVGTMLVLLVVVLMINIKEYTASSKIVRAESTQNTDEQIALYIQATHAWSPHAQSLRQRSANMLFEHTAKEEVDARKQLDTGITIMELAHTQSPHKFSYLFTLGNLHAKKFARNLEQTYETADAYYEKSQSLSPRRAAVLFQQANIRTIAQEYDEALTYLDKALGLIPDDGQAQFIKGVTLTFADQEKRGLEIIRNALKTTNYQPNIIVDMQHVTKVAIKHGDMFTASHMMAWLTFAQPYEAIHWDNLNIVIHEPGADRQIISHVMNELQSALEVGRVDPHIQPYITFIRDEIKNSETRSY